jgi:hypothetical protein
MSEPYAFDCLVAVSSNGLLGRPPTSSRVSESFDAGYVALPQLQADAFVTLDRQLAQAVAEFVVVAPIEELY